MYGSLEAKSVLLNHHLHFDKNKIWNSEYLTKQCTVSRKVQGEIDTLAKNARFLRPFQVPICKFGKLNFRKILEMASRFVFKVCIGNRLIEIGQSDLKTNFLNGNAFTWV